MKIALPTIGLKSLDKLVKLCEVTNPDNDRSMMEI